jgi:hypothetical protein
MVSAPESLANIAATRRMGPVTWKIAENSNRPGYRPSATGRKRYVRMGPEEVSISTDSVSLIIIPFSDVDGIEPQRRLAMQPGRRKRASGHFL